MGILKDAGIDPAPQRTSDTWATFLRSQARAIIAADFFETTALTGAHMYVLAAIEHATRRVRILGVTAHPTVAWVAQGARYLVMDLDDARCQVKYLIRDRDGKYPDLFDAILADAGTTVVLSGVRIPRGEHWGIANARPLRPLPEPLTDPTTLTRRACVGTIVSAASSTNTTTMPPDLRGRDFRHPQP